MPELRLLFLAPNDGCRTGELHRYRSGLGPQNQVVDGARLALDHETATHRIEVGGSDPGEESRGDARLIANTTSQRRPLGTFSGTPDSKGRTRRPAATVTIYTTPISPTPTWLESMVVKWSSPGKVSHTEIRVRDARVGRLVQPPAPARASRLRAPGRV